MAAAEGGKPYPLEGLKVLDFSRVLAGPFAGRLLSDLGADVVKVEPPEGDITRSWGKVTAGLPGYYHQQNAGKRNISLDLRAEGARELVLELVRRADVVIENYRPDVMGRLGLGYEALSAVNPRLIMLSISGFGHGGPESRRPAYAPIVHAELGLIDRGARRTGAAHQDLPLSVADTNASLHGMIALLAAVVLRARTGRGQHIDLAMIDATMAADDMLPYDLEGAWDTAPMPNDIWTTGAGPVLLSADFRHLFRQLTATGQLADPSAPEMTLEGKIAARRAAVGAFFARLESYGAVDAAMERAGIVWGRVREAADLPNQPTVKHRGAIAQVDDRAGGTRPVVQSPYRFSDAQSGVRGPAPHRGEHNAEVLGEWLGLDAAAVAGLGAAGVLR